MPLHVVVGLIVTVLVALAAGSSHAADRLATVAGWQVRADRFADGAPYCYAGADRGPGDRMNVVLSDVGLLVVLSRANWNEAPRQLNIELAVDDAWRAARPASVEGRTLILLLDAGGPAHLALRRGKALTIDGGESIGPSTWSLAGGGAALKAIEQCYEARLARRRAAKEPRQGTGDGEVTERTLAK